MPSPDNNSTKCFGGKGFETQDRAYELAGWGVSLTRSAKQAQAEAGSYRMIEMFSLHSPWINDKPGYGFSLFTHREKPNFRWTSAGDGILEICEAAWMAHS